MRTRFTRRRLFLLGVVALFGFLFTQWRAAITRNRSIADEPFQIAGNLYYVGHTGVTAFLLTGPEGHVLIDGGFPEHPPLIAQSVAKLGFDISDVRILLNSHAHSDHAGGLKGLQEMSGARLWVSEGDAEAMSAGGGVHDLLPPVMRFLRVLGIGKFPAPRVDHRFADGDTVRLGPLELVAHVTAGHTRGCTSWSFTVPDGDRDLEAVSICSLTVLPFTSLVEPETYPGIRADYERSFQTLRELPVDIFLASHGDWFGLPEKREKQVGTPGPGAFLDHSGYLQFIDRAEARFLERLAEQEER